MTTKAHIKKKPVTKSKSAPSVQGKAKSEAAETVEQEPAEVITAESLRPKETAKEREARERRQEILHRMLLTKRQEIIKEIEGNLGQSLTEDQQRRLESARDVGDQALMDLERELGISLMEMRNRRRQSIDMRRLQVSCPIARQIPPAQIIRKNQDKIHDACLLPPTTPVTYVARKINPNGIHVPSGSANIA